MSPSRTGSRRSWLGGRAATRSELSRTRRRRSHGGMRATTGASPSTSKRSSARRVHRSAAWTRTRSPRRWRTSSPSATPSCAIWASAMRCARRSSRWPPSWRRSPPRGCACACGGARGTGSYGSDCRQAHRRWTDSRAPAAEKRPPARRSATTRSTCCAKSACRRSKGGRAVRRVVELLPARVGRDALRRGQRVPVHLVDRELAPERNELHGAPPPRLVARPGAVLLAPDHLDERLAVADEDDFAERRDPPVVLELVAAIVVLRARAGNLNHDDGV